MEPRTKEILEKIVALGLPTVKGFITETINHIPIKKQKVSIQKELDQLLPLVPPTCMNIQYQNKEHYMFLYTCDRAIYNVDIELGKIINDDSDGNDITYLKNQMGVALSAPLNLYKNFLHKNESFANRLIAALPEGRKDIDFKVDHNTSLLYVYEDGTFVGVVIDPT
jgi:hypothetical protein